jgi:uncharacterized protein YicC (UPF0701 family)
MMLGVLLSASAAAQSRGNEASVSPVETIAAMDGLIDALERENAALRARLEDEKAATALLQELNETRKSENRALADALAAKNETLAAKEQVIDSQEKLIAGLKTRKTSIWKRIGDIAVGAAIGAILR